MTGGERLRVRGGVGGTAARFEDLDAAATLLRDVATGLGEVGRRVVPVLADPGRMVTAARAPATFVPAQLLFAAAVGGPDGVVPAAVRAELLGRSLAAAVTAYRAAEVAVAARVRLAGITAGRVSGAVAGRVLGPVLAGGAAAGSVALAAAGPRPGPGGTPPRPDANGPGGPAAPGVPASRLVVLPGGTGVVVQRVAAAVPAFAGGLVDTWPGVGHVWGAVSGRGWPPAGVPGLAGHLAAAGRAGPLLREGGARVVAVTPVAARPPAGVADLVRRIPRTAADSATVRVERVEVPGRRAWVVVVPGTGSWSPTPAGTPFDLTGNVHVMAGQESAGGRAVAEAMRAARVPAGEPVLLAGYSQGGLVAAALAADPAFRRSFDVTHVLTVGAPVGAAAVPGDVEVLSLEHAEDAVPGLDGAANPDRPSWVTVTGRAGAGGIAAHEAAAHVRTAEAVDGSAHPSVREWRRGLEPFLARPGAEATAAEVTVERAP